jgi:hypothetical protein
MTGQWAAQGFFHRGPAPQPGPADRAADVLVQAPERSDDWVAETAGCYKRTVAKVRCQLEAEGVIPAYRPDVRARGAPGARTRQAYRPPLDLLNPVPELTEMPAIMAEGLCMGHPDPDLWQSAYAGQLSGRRRSPSAASAQLSPTAGSGSCSSRPERTRLSTAACRPTSAST